MIITATTAVLYPIVIQFKRGGWWSILKPFALIVAILDVIANYTEVAFVFGKTPEGCHTISQRMDWMVENGSTQARKDFAKMVNVFLDACEDDGEH